MQTIATLGLWGVGKSMTVAQQALREMPGLDLLGARENGPAAPQQLDGEFAQMTEALHRLQKMEVVAHLASGMVHDFNNLLTIIAGSLDRAQARIAQGRFDDLPGQIAAAGDATRRAAAVNQRLLALSRQTEIDPIPTDVVRLVADMQDLIRCAMSLQIQVEFVLPPNPCIAIVDTCKLESAVLNLCINARDAMLDGGRLLIEIAERSLDTASGSAHNLPPGEYIALSVVDSGSGMAAETASRAFAPLFTTKPVGKGSGLGLSAVAAFVRQSRGQATITSELGVGTTVHLLLPRSAIQPGHD